VLVAGCAALGLFVGSFLGLVAVRMPAGEGVTSGRSHCDACRRPLAWFEVVPVVSWIALGGRCRTCRQRVPAASTLIELATAALFGAMAVRFDMHWELGGFLVLAAALVVLTAIDLRTRTLPRQILYVAAVGGIPFLVVGALVEGEPLRLWWSAVGAAGALAFFLLLYLAWTGAMGDGDVRLATLLGLFLGWIGPLHVPVGLFLGFFTGAIVGVAMIAAGRGGRRTALPFGPFLAIGATVTILAGRQIIDVWLGR
jgi:leader peptidase (prepilin peptidase) / N-methyltransferase